MIHETPVINANLSESPRRRDDAAPIPFEGTPMTHTSPIKLSEVDPLKTQLDTHQASAITGISPTTLINDRSLGRSKIPYRKFGRTVKYEYADVLAYIESHPKIEAFLANGGNPVDTSAGSGTIDRQ